MKVLPSASKRSLAGIYRRSRAYRYRFESNSTPPANTRTAISSAASLNAARFIAPRSSGLDRGHRQHVAVAAIRRAAAGADGVLRRTIPGRELETAGTDP